MKVNILFIFVFFVLVDSQTELKYDILGCPFGWKASGQAWYAPKYEKDDFTNYPEAFAAVTSYSSSFQSQSQSQNGYHYFPEEYNLCLICESDLYSLLYPGLTWKKHQRWIEVCVTNFTRLRTKQLKYEQQTCSLSNVQHTETHFFTYENTLNWCRFQPVCAINVSLSFNFLYDALRLTSPILCSEYYKQSAKNKNMNLYKFVDLVCPSGFITHIEMHYTLCQGALTPSLCILCSSEEAEFSVCYTKDCVERSPIINFNSLVIPDSNFPALDFVSKNYCGVKVDLDLTYYKLLNETNLIVCNEGNYENALAISLAVFCATTFVLIIIVSILSIKLCRRNGTDRQQSQEQDPPLADHVYYNTNDSGNIEFLHVNPYYE